MGGYQDATEHGFLRDADGSFTLFDVPGSASTLPFGINDVGQIVGLSYRSATGEHGFLRDAGGSFTFFDAPWPVLGPRGINKVGQIVGFYQDATGGHGFLREADGSFTSFFIVPHGINDAGQIVGSYQDATGGHGFLATPSSLPITLIDPVPDLLSGPHITTAVTAAQEGLPYLADLTKGTVVKGVATDGVAQVVLRIPAKSVGEQFDLSVRADQCADLIARDCIDQYGLLFDPSNPPADIFSNPSGQPLLVTAVSTDNGPMAFAAYRAPADFVRYQTSCVMWMRRIPSWRCATHSLPLTPCKMALSLIWQSIWSGPWWCWFMDFGETGMIGTASCLLFLLPKHDLW